MMDLIFVCQPENCKKNQDKSPNVTIDLHFEKQQILPRFGLFDDPGTSIPPKNFDDLFIPKPRILDVFPEIHGERRPVFEPPGPVQTSNIQACRIPNTPGSRSRYHGTMA